MSNYHLADTKTQWLEDKFPGAPMNLIPANTVLVLHTTEGTGWEDYAGGSEAPTYTAQPPVGRKKGAWRAHFPDERSARALVNAPGGVETNTMNCVQVELVGTCDPSHAKTWGSLKAGVDYVYWPEATDAQLKWLADFVADMHKRHGLKLVAPKVWLAYGPDARRKDGKSPAAYGDNGVRMTGPQWSRFAGICGHQHVPENDHGDPGALPVDRLLTFVHALVDPAPAAEPASAPARSALMPVDTNVNQRDKGFRSYYAATFPGSSLCWDVRMPVLNTHDSRLIDAIFGWGVTFAAPRVVRDVLVGRTTATKPACLDHKALITQAEIGGVSLRVGYQSLNDKRNANGSWQAPTRVVVPWLTAMAENVDVLVCDEALMPLVRPSLKRSLGKGWDVRQAGEYLVAIRKPLLAPAAKGLVWVLSKIAGLVGWRQDHAGAFEYTMADGHQLLVVPNHAPAGVENGAQWKPGKQLDAHKAGDVALNARIQNWLAAK